MFECFFEWFSVGFWSHFGSLLGPFWDPFSICFPMKKYIDFSTYFWSPFVRISNPRTPQNEALAYTKRSFSKKRLFRPSSDFWSKMEAEMDPKRLQNAFTNQLKNQCIFSLKQIQVLSKNGPQMEPQRAPKTLILEVLWGVFSRTSPTDPKWSPNGSKMEPKWSPNRSKID